ncbi:MAG: hypothetical protein ACTTHG_02725 [Treponemataceae bacterium]
MKIIFAFSQSTDFTKEYIKSLKNFYSVLSVFINFDKNLQLKNSQADYILQPKNFFKNTENETQLREEEQQYICRQAKNIIDFFNPDVIHCNDPNSFFAFEFAGNTIYSCHLTKTELLKNENIKLEQIAVKKSSLCCFYEKTTLLRFVDFAPNAACVYISKYSVHIHSYYYLQICHSRYKNIKAAYGNEFFKIALSLPYFLPYKQNSQKFNSFLRLEIFVLKRIFEYIENNQKVLVLISLTDVFILKKIFPFADFINIMKPAANGIYYRSECLPFNDKSYDFIILSGVSKKCCNLKFSIQEINRISKKNFFIFDYKGKVFSKKYFKKKHFLTFLLIT